MDFYTSDGVLYHHGISGQKWGVRNGPPYPLKNGNTIKKGTEVQSIVGTYVNPYKKNEVQYGKEHSKDKIKNRPFYGAYTSSDKIYYLSTMGNTKKYNASFKVTRKAKKDMKIASEKDAVDVIKDSYANDKNFKEYMDFVISSCLSDGQRQRMQQTLKTSDGKKLANQMDNFWNLSSNEQFNTAYSLFNITLPQHWNDDVVQSSFYDKLKEKGYSAVKDLYDGKYGQYSTENPVIVFDSTSLGKTYVNMVTPENSAAIINTFAKTQQGKQAIQTEKGVIWGTEVKKLLDKDVQVYMTEVALENNRTVWNIDHYEGPNADLYNKKLEEQKKEKN